MLIIVFVIMQIRQFLLIGECNYRNVEDGIAEIGIKICETDCQNRGVGRKVLSMLIGWLFRNGYQKQPRLDGLLSFHIVFSFGYLKLGKRQPKHSCESSKRKFEQTSKLNGF